MQIREKGYQVTLTSTGICTVKYFYPISFKYYNLFSEISATLGAKIVQGSKPNSWYVVYETTGDSVSCFSAVNAVQKKLKIMSRSYKLNTLVKELQALQA